VFAWLQSKMAGDNDKSRVLGVLLFLLALTTAFQHQFAIIIMIFQRQQQQTMNNNIDPAGCTSVWSSSLFENVGILMAFGRYM